MLFFVVRYSFQFSFSLVVRFSDWLPSTFASCPELLLAVFGYLYLEDHGT